MNYHYKAINAEGGIVTGVVSADNLRFAVRVLQQQGLNVVDVGNGSDAVTPGDRRRKRASAQDVLMFMHQFCTLLESGVSLEETVESLSESAGHPGLARAFADVAAALRQGVSFSESLKDCGLSLPGYFRALAEAGELTGNMAQAMRDGVTQWEYDIRTANELRNALTYPLILVISGIGAVMLIFALVVPRFVKLLDRAQGEVPLLARLVLGTGNLVNEHIAVLSGITVALGAAAAYVFCHPDMRQRGRDFLARVPFLNAWLLETDIGRWSAMLATLLENRVDLLRALELAQHYVTLTAFQARLSHVSQSVRNGASLAKSLQGMHAVTATGYNLIKVGERSGKLPDMLRSLAILHTESGRNRIKRFLIILEPAAILIIGTVVGVIMAGIILAITSVNNISL